VLLMMMMMRRVKWKVMKGWTGSAVRAAANEPTGRFDVQPNHRFAIRLTTQRAQSNESQ
jgi:hypothetical protein